MLGQNVGDLLAFQRNELQNLVLKTNGVGDDLISNVSSHRMGYVVGFAVKPNTVALELTADKAIDSVIVADAEEATTLALRVTSRDKSSTTAYNVALRHYLGPRSNFREP